MKNGKKVYYWDTCIFLTLLTADQSDADLYEGVLHIIKQLDDKKCYLVTSQITRTEILESKQNANAKKILEAVLKRSNVMVIDLTEKIATLASSIRDNLENKYSIKLKTPDAIHVATGIFIPEVDEIHSTDRLVKNSLNEKLNFEHQPIICKPSVPNQTVLKFTDLSKVAKK